MLIVNLNCWLTYADGLSKYSTNQLEKIGDYTMMRGTNGHYMFANPKEFWNGVWKEDTNGWRVQLRVYSETHFRFQNGVAYPLFTNVVLRVEWGSAVRNSGGGYYMTPNGKFAAFQLSDAEGNVIPSNPHAGTNLLLNILKGRSLVSFPDIPRHLGYETRLPAWASPASGSLVAPFPKEIATNVYPHFENGELAGGIISATNQPPFYLGLLRLDEIYCVTNKGSYALTVQPVLYKRRKFPDDAILDRVDLPSVSAEVYLFPNQ
jgi:hypothetical protein